MAEQLTAIFCDVDDFCIEYEKYCKTHLLMDERQIVPQTSMSMSEIMTIVIYYHLSHHREFKWYYLHYICGTMRKYFPKTLSYNRFVEVMKSVTAPLTLYLMKYCLGKCSGISFADSTTLDVCNNRRISSHKVFDGIAKRGKSSTGWFYGFKLHLAINDKGEIIAFCLTPGNVDDRDWSVISKLTAEMFGKLFADRGYISANLFAKLWVNGVQLITKLKSNMKNKLMDFTDKLLLRKRAVIECVNDFLKNICQIEHSRHRSVHNFIVNLISGLIAYSFLPKKPSLHISAYFSLIFRRTHVILGRLIIPYGKCKVSRSGNSVIEFFTDSEMQTLREIFKSDIYLSTFALLLEKTCVRVSEALALKVEDIDWENKQLHVIRAFTVDEDEENEEKVAIKKTVSLGGPKKGSSRTLDIPDILLDTLKKYINETNKNKAIKKTRDKNGFIFLTEDGEIQTRFGMRRRYETILGKANCKIEFGFHKYRHTYSTKMSEDGVNDTLLQYLMGHKDIAITRKYYIGVTKKMRETGRKIIENWA